MQNLEFDAQNLTILDIPADLVVIHPFFEQNKKSVHLSVTGPENALEKISVSPQGDTVVVQGTDLEYTTDIVISAYVPMFSIVGITNVNGSVTIGDTQGYLNLGVKYGGDTVVKLGNISLVSADILGGLSIILASSNQVNADLKVATKGNLRLYGNKLGDLKLKVEGAGMASINSVSTNANLELNGSGTIYLQGNSGLIYKKKGNDGHMIFGGLIA